MNLIQEEKVSNLQTHIENFKRKRKEGQNQDYRISKISTIDQNKCICKSHYSSIHKCKPTCSQGLSFNDVKKTGHFNGKIEKELDNFITGGSITSSERIENGMNEFATYSNISAVPNHVDDYVYSSVGEMAELMTHEKENDNLGFKRIKKQQSRYNDSFGVKELEVNTSPAVLLLKDICEGRSTMKNDPRQQNILRNSRKMNGSHSTKNLNATSFLNPHKTVSINLFCNDSIEEIKNSELSESSMSQMNIENNIKYQN